MSFRVVPCNHTLITQQKHIYKHKQSLIPQARVSREYSNAFKLPSTWGVLRCKTRPPRQRRDLQEKRLVLAVYMLTQKLKAVYDLWMGFKPLRERGKK